MKSAWLLTHPLCVCSHCSSSRPANGGSGAAAATTGQMLVRDFGAVSSPVYLSLARLRSSGLCGSYRQQGAANGLPIALSGGSNEGPQKLVSGLGPSATLRRTRRVITDNFTTTLAPASRVLDLGLRNSFGSDG